MTTNGSFNRKLLQRRLRFYRGEADDRADIYVATTEKELKLRWPIISASTQENEKWLGHRQRVATMAPLHKKEHFKPSSEEKTRQAKA